MGRMSAIFEVDGKPAEAELLARMQSAAPHHGEGATLRRERLALAHAPSPASPSDGRVAESGPLAVVVTGRLYNGGEIARSLGLSHPGGDAALLLAAYSAWGEGCVERLDGDFAFVLFDGARRRLLCARDALGVKPLYYAYDGHRFLAASEPRQLLAAGVSAEPCEETIAFYLSLTVHLCGGPRSYYREILRLEPGHLLVVDEGGPRMRRYWHLDPEHEIEERDEEAIVERVRWLMADAVARRTPTAPPYGCALSGGFDSSSVAGLLRRHLDGQGVDTPLETFSFELRDLAADEPEIIDIVAAQVGANHHHLYLDQDNVFEALPAILHATDEPTRDMGLLYLWRKKQEAQRLGIPVVLSGLGGDELFFGRYHYFADLARHGRLLTLAQEVRSLYPVDRSTGKRISLSGLLLNYVLAPLLPRRPKKLARRLLKGESLVGPWVHPELARRTQLAARILEGPPCVFPDAYRQECYESFYYVLVNVTLPIHEALGAACGVETRFPLLDRRLVEYMFAVPRELKIRRGASRIVQRRAMEGILPEVVLKEHLKKNLNPVLWRQQRHNLRAALESLFEQRTPRSDGYLNWPYLRRLHDGFRGGSDVGMYWLWYALNLERWLEQCERGEA